MADKDLSSREASLTKSSPPEEDLRKKRILEETLQRRNWEHEEVGCGEKRWQGIGFLFLMGCSAHYTPVILPINSIWFQKKKKERPAIIRWPCGVNADVNPSSSSLTCRSLK